MKQLNTKEQQSLILGIAKAFSRVCEKNDIPYYMLGGTMLGAIRHQGFIPWDDDMDFGVPRQFYEKLKVVLEDQLPDRYKCRTFFNSKNVVYGYIKIEDTFTKCNNAQFKKLGDDRLGLDLDIFPLDSCNCGDKKIKKIIWLNDKYGRIFTASATRNLWKNILKKLIRLVFPFTQKFCYNYIEKQIGSINPGEFLANIYGHWEDKEIVPKAWYGENIKYKFEDTEFCGFLEYDLYLRQLYGDYMKLPPVELQKGHSNAGVFLIRDK